MKRQRRSASAPSGGGAVCSAVREGLLSIRTHYIAELLPIIRFIFFFSGKRKKKEMLTKEPFFFQKY